MRMRELSEVELQRNTKNVNLICSGLGGAAGLIVIYFLMVLGLVSSNKGFGLIITMDTFFLIVSFIGVFNTFILARTNPTPIKFFINTLKNSFKKVK
ncbi:hypothetical protein [uncultured Clostridium sp.]|uniref:hypothetical protein n=1 Tax=uncultured Clostridium sp. TaxID=59620 RepID=UPI0028E9519F|nr:hypothetical protein [uncultured Clostridium sp.]